MRQAAAFPPLDVIFPVLHGPFGEDGTIQGLLELAGLPYVGSRRAGQRAGHGQDRGQDAFAAHDLPQAPHVAVKRKDWEAARRGRSRDLEGLCPTRYSSSRPTWARASASAKRVTDGNCAAAETTLPATIASCWSSKPCPTPERSNAACWATMTQSHPCQAKSCQATSSTTTRPSIWTAIRSCSSRRRCRPRLARPGARAGRQGIPGH